MPIPICTHARQWHGHTHAPRQGPARGFAQPQDTFNTNAHIPICIPAAARSGRMHTRRTAAARAPRRCLDQIRPGQAPAICGRYSHSRIWPLSRGRPAPAYCMRINIGTPAWGIQKPRWGLRCASPGPPTAANTAHAASDDAHSNIQMNSIPNGHADITRPQEGKFMMIYDG